MGDDMIIFFAILLIASFGFVVKIWLDPNRIKSMSNEQIRHEKIIRGLYKGY